MASTTAIIEGNMWGTDGSWNSQHFFDDAMTQFGISGFLQVNLPTTYQTSTEMASNYFEYAPSEESRSRDSSEPTFPAGDDENSSGLLVPSRSNSSQDSELQLRSASRKSKNRKRRRPVLSNSQKHARECHNLVEKQYRTRLKAQFENLLAVLPTPQDPNYAGKDATGNPGRYLSRGQVLDAAKERIIKLEKEVELSTLRRDRLLEDMAQMERTLLEEKNRAALFL
ncbi:uncharacterized protein FTOL_13588 [Fusarium torulosum]|uniref:BHLH domain-containing protein n=1 Tax=Fusarium torulosum TaxID=33205 RepID=A0AAE8MPA4_9HYPO|nr:uncharacterized protein FTOL_13588 [Fusarium torulosum]